MLKSHHRKTAKTYLLNAIAVNSWFLESRNMLLYVKLWSVDRNSLRIVKERWPSEQQFVLLSEDVRKRKTGTA
eukprot:EC725914.1.p3 GENE.EC725914.1~~EC725914.1.p3  ORF type:complete len:73 (+),score=8.89 EC725914.1:296-514(+)